MENEKLTINEENYKPFFNNSYKSLRIIKNRNNDNTYKNNAATLRQIDKAIILPITKNRDEIFNSILNIFGKNYKRYIKNYFFPKRYKWVKKLVKGPMIKHTFSKPYIQEYVKGRLLDFPTMPNDRIVNKKDTIIDYTDIYNKIIINNESFFSKPIVRRYSENMIIEVIIRSLFGAEYLKNGDTSLFPYTSGLNIFSSMGEEPNFPNIGFDKYVIPYKVELTSLLPLQFNYFNGSTALNSSMKKNPNIIYDVGLFLFLNHVIDKEYYEQGKDPYHIIKNAWIDIFVKYNPIFYFYNSKFGFVLDIRQLKENMRWNHSKIIKKFRDLLVLLVRYNINDLSDEELDDIIASEVEESDILEKNVGLTPEKEVKILNFLKENNLSRKISSVYSSLVKSIIDNAKIKNNKLEFIKGTSLKDGKNESKIDDLMSSLKSYDDSDEFDKTYDDTEEIENEYDEKKENETIEINDEDEIDEETKNFQEKNSKKQEIYEEINDEDEIDEEIAIDKELPDNKIQEQFFKNIKKEMEIPISPKQKLRLDKIKEKYKSVSLDGKNNIYDIINDIEATMIEPVSMDTDLVDNSFNNINIVDWENTYVEKTFKKDIVKCLNSFNTENNKIKLYVQDMKISDSSDQFTKKETIEVVYEDNNFNKHKLKFDLPKFDKNHRMTLNGNTMDLKKQIIFLPIVKISPDMVWITSQFNKLYMERVNYTTNRSTHILNHLLINYLKDNPKIKIEFGDATEENSEFLTTIEYDDIASKILSISLDPDTKNEIFFSFYQSDIRKKIKNHFKDYNFKNDMLPIGIDYSKNNVLSIKLNDKQISLSEYILNYIKDRNLIENYDSIVKNIKIPKRKSYTRVMFMSKKIPTIIFLSYLWGLNKVIQTAKINVTISEKPIRNDKRIVIPFKDCYLYYGYYPLENSFLLNGLNYMDTREININDMNTDEPYLEWLYQMFESRNIAKGWMDFKELFLDGITLEILRDMKLPTDLLELMLYANDLLGDNSFTHESNGDIEYLYRIRGEEVIVETLYKCIAEQLKVLGRSKNPSKGTISIPQDAILAKLFKLSTFNSYDITNPINEMKQRGIVSFKGSSGTNESRAFTAGKRGYGEQYAGIFAMSSPDNFQVGISKQLTANPNIVSTRGYIKTYKNRKELDKAESSSLISLEEATYPYAIDRDDPKRISYTSGQSVHGVKSKYSVPNLVRGPIDRIIAKTTTDSFAPKAVKDGEIIEIDEKNGKIYVKYNDGETEIVKIGTKYVTNSSFLLDINLESNVKKGEKIKKGDVIAYDRNFFQKEGKDLVYKQGPIGFLCIHESDSTEEDSSFITEEFAAKMSTDVIQAKGIVLTPNTNLISWKKIGDHVISEDPLMLFEYTDTSANSKILELLGEIDEETKAETMQKSARTEYSGIVTDMKVYWTVPLEDLTPSLRSFVEEYIKKVKSECNAEKKITGKDSEKLLESEMSIPKFGKLKKYMIPDEGGVLVEFFISHEQGMSIGDKSTNSTSIKSIIMDVVEQKNAPYTESGLTLDGQISYLSIAARHVLSITYVGLISKILFDFSKEQAEYYFDKKN